MSDEKIPEFLVRVDYEVPPTRGIMPMYFDEVETATDLQYTKAVLVFHPTAIIRKVTRKIKVETGGKGGL